MTDSAEILQAPMFYRGRVALYSILRCLGVSRGDEVIIQAFTCIAVPEAVFAIGAKPVFVDIEEGGFNMDPARLAERISTRTKAVVVQHTFGIPAKIAQIVEIARRYGVPVIEDCCHTYGSKVEGRPVGSFGVAAFYSFEWGKPVILGLGGAAVVQDPELRHKISALHATEFRVPPTLGQLRLEAQYMAFSVLYRPSLYWFVRGAFRLLSSLGVAEGSFNALSDTPADDFSWSMAPILKRRLTAKFKKLPAIETTARAVVRQYRERLSAAGVIHPVIDEENHVLVRYPLRVDDKSHIMENARRAKVEFAPWYATPVHPIPVARLGMVGLDPAEIPQAMRRCFEIVSLPINARVTQDSIERTARLLEAC